MLPKSVRNCLVVLPLLLSLAGCRMANYLADSPIRPPAPEQLPAMQKPMSLPAKDSVIILPIPADLSAFLKNANDEHVIPKAFDHWGTYIKNTKGVDYKYYAEREDFSVNSSAPTVSRSMAEGAPLRDWWKGVELSAPNNIYIGAALRYKIGVHPQTGSSGASVQCGDGGEWPRRATLNGMITVGMTPNYDLSASVADVAVNAIDPCPIRIADIDVAQEVNNKLADIVRGGLNNAVAPINAISVKSQMEEVWGALRKPIRLESDVWLQMNIDKIGHSGFSGSAQVVENTIHLIAKPVLVFGAEPPPALAGLPQLEARPGSNGFHIVADAQLDYATLSKTLADRLKGKRVYTGVGYVRITDASIYGNGGNQVVIRIDFGGDAWGHAYFVGKPELNVLTQTVYIGDLHYDLATQNVLQQQADWLYHSTFREFISGEAVFGVASVTHRVRDLLAPALNRPLNPTISMQGTVASVQGTEVYADANALYVRAVSDGTLNVKVADKP